MKAIKREKLSRSKSIGFLDKVDNEHDFKCVGARFCDHHGSDNLHGSVSSVEACYCEGTESSAEESKLDSGLGKSSVDDETLLILDQKIDKLNELLQVQHNLLMSIKEKVIRSKTECDRHGTAGVRGTPGEGSDGSSGPMLMNKTMNLGASANENADGEESAARSLHGAIETEQIISLDYIVRVALENFLQSDDVKEQVTTTTAECVKEVVRDTLCQVVSGAYLPMVERSHRRLVRHVTKLLDDSFADLEEGTATLFKSIHKTSRNIRMSVEKHQNILEATDPVKNMKLLRTVLKGVLEEELKSWRGRVMQELTSAALWDSRGGSEPPEPLDPACSDFAPTSPTQPANPGTSIIDTLMKCALITKHVEEGDVNGAFEEALGSADLALVVAACRAARPSPGALRPAVLLSLLQQLATDMVHDTQLKCRYLEETILSLDKCDTATREHLPLVVGEVRKHLTKFLMSYPKHHASRRVALIVMAADNLVK